MNTTRPRRAFRTAPARAWTCAIVACVLSGAGGCVQQVTPEAEQLLIDSKAAYARGDDAAVVRDTSSFLAGFDKTNLAEVAYYLRGLSRYRQGELGSAKSDLKIAASSADRQDVRMKSLKALADLAFEEGDVDWAEGLYGQALAEVKPKKPPADEIRYRLGCVLQRKGRWDEADEQFDRVAHVYAGTEVARRAQLRLRCRAWTVQAAAFGRKDLADAESARLRGQQLPAVTRSVISGDSLRFVVQVGRYATYEQAAAALPAVRRHRGDAFVTSTR